MDITAAEVRFDEIALNDIEEFHRQHQKIHAAVHDRLVHTALLRGCMEDKEKLRVSDEVSAQFIDIFFTSVKYAMPRRTIEYLDWLGRFLDSRDFPSSYLPHLLRATRQAAHAFVTESSSDGIGCALHTLSQRYSTTDRSEERST